MDSFLRVWKGRVIYNLSMAAYEDFKYPTFERAKMMTNVDHYSNYSFLSSPLGSKTDELICIKSYVCLVTDILNFKYSNQTIWEISWSHCSVTNGQLNRLADPKPFVYSLQHTNNLQTKFQVSRLDRSQDIAMSRICSDQSKNKPLHQISNLQGIVLREWTDKRTYRPTDWRICTKSSCVQFALQLWLGSYNFHCIIDLIPHSKIQPSHKNYDFFVKNSSFGDSNNCWLLY